MDVHFDDSVTEVERAEVATWADLHDADGVETVVIGAFVVAVHSAWSSSGVVGTAIRRTDVVAALDEALAMMRRSRDG